MTRLRTAPGLRLVVFVSFAVAGFELARSARSAEWTMQWGVHPDARAALQLHCGDLSYGEKRECREHLRSEFARDSDHAQALIRLHCTRIETVWSEAPADPAPAICTDRFGGWLRG